jgi:hypothetical protein
VGLADRRARMPRNSRDARNQGAVAILLRLLADLRDGEGGDLGRRFDERGEISVDDGTPLIVTVFNTVISAAPR